jgi:NADP-dependent 3-hydroxy acid dehydrogenase YdfG
MPPTDASDSFSGFRVLVTGASAGIGRETARQFSSRGADVLATGLEDAPLAELAAQASDAGLKLRIIAGDVTDIAFLHRLNDIAGDVDVLVNCAGWVKHAPFLESDSTDWEKVFAVNVIALLRLTQLVARGMRDRRKGHIINISSILARRVYSYTLAYAATKHAVRAISDGLRIELQGSNVKVTEIAPGLTDTNIFRDIDHPLVKQQYAKFNFAKLEPREVARAILFAAAAPPESCPEVLAVNPLGQA